MFKKGKNLRCCHITDLIEMEGLWQKQISTWDVEWYLQFNVKDQLGDMVHLCAWMGLLSVRRWKEEERDYAMLSQDVDWLWWNSFLPFEFDWTLYTCCLQILLVARMEWKYRIMGRHMSSEMTASCGMLFKSI